MSPSGRRGETYSQQVVLLATMGLFQPTVVNFPRDVLVLSLQQLPNRACKSKPQQNKTETLRC